MNINQWTLVWNQFKFQLPMIICAAFVIVSQRKIIWNTLKRWWSWGFNNWPQERIDYMVMFLVGVVIFSLTALAGKAWKQKIIEKQQQEVMEKMLEENLITQEQLDNASREQEQRERERERDDHRK